MTNSYTYGIFKAVCKSQIIVNFESCQSYTESCFACAVVFMSVRYPGDAGTSHSRPKCFTEG